MPFFLMLLLALLGFQEQWPTPPSWFSWWASLLTPLGGLLILWVSAAWLARRQSVRLLREPDQRTALMRRFQGHRHRHFLVLTAFYLTALFFLGWGWAISFIWEDLPGRELLLFAPLVAGLLLLWSRYYEVDRTTHDLLANPEKPPFPTRTAYVILQARHNLLLIVPLVCLELVQRTLLYLVPEVRQHPGSQAALGLSLVGFALLTMPFVLKRFLGLVPLPDGPLRDRLLAAATRLNLRFRDVLLWPTRGTVANAMVTGVMPWNRYIVVSDRLVDELTHEEVEAVFGHEVGHVKHHHLICYLVFLLASVVAWAGLGQLVKAVVQVASNQAWIQNWLTLNEEWLQAVDFFAAIPALGGIGVYLFLVFGYLSRRCERQADMFGCRSTDTPTFISALEKVAHLNGIPLDKPGWLSCWLHGSIGQRIGVLKQMIADPCLEPQFQKRVRLLQWGLPGSLVLLAFVLAVLNYQLHTDLWKMLTLI